MPPLTDKTKGRLEAAREQIAKLIQRDAKVKDETDLYNRLLKQARANEGLFEPCDAELPLHKQPQFMEAPGGFAPMPAALKQAATEQLEYHMFVGLFPEIHRAWLTIDHMLFLWDYNHPSGSFYQYDGLEQTIINAALVPCKPGVFAAEATPRHLLLLSTPSEVVVLAVYPTGPAGAEDSTIDIHETGFAVPSDGVNFVAMAHTPCGRVFMAGADGFLHELQYGFSERWLGGSHRMCQKKNVSRKRDRAYNFVLSAFHECADPIVQLEYDAERNILYSLTAASALGVYDLGEKGDSLRYVASMDARAVHHALRHSGAIAGDSKTLQRLDEDIKAAERAPAASRELSPAFVALAPIPSTVSHLMQLELVSSSGVRVCVRVAPNTADGRRSHPAEIRPLFAVAPPRASDGRPLRCSRGAALVAGDTTLLAPSVEDAAGAVELLCVSELLAARGEDGKPASDAASLTRLRLRGSLFAVAEEPRPGPPPLGSALATQHSAALRSFVLLTSEGVQRVHKRRPLDPLLAAASPRSAAAQQLGLPSPANDFFSFYGADEACSMCLLAVLSPGADQPTAGVLAGWAQHHGGVVAGAAPAMSEAFATAQGVAIRGQAQRHSGRHGGICRAVARLLHESWSQPLCCSTPRGGLALRHGRPFWLRLHASLTRLVAHLESFSGEWGLTPAGAGAPPAGGMEGSRSRLRASVGSIVYADRAVAESRWRSMERTHASEKEAESLSAVICLARRVAQLSLLLAAVAEHDEPAAAPPIDTAADAGAGRLLSPEVAPGRLAELPELPPKLKAHLAAGLTLQGLAVPLLLDGRGKPQPGRWDADIEARLPKALFHALGAAEAAGGAAVTRRLQAECPELFSSADASSLKAWELLSRADAPTTAEPDRAALLSDALAAFLPAVSADASVDLAVLVDAFFAHHARAKRASAPPVDPAPGASPVSEAAERALVQLPLAAVRAADPDNLAPQALSAAGAAAGVDGWSKQQRGAICARLRCYRVLLDKLDFLARPPLPVDPHKAPGPAAASAAAAPAAAAAAAGEGWSRLLREALRQAPSDELLLDAAAWWLLYGNREEELVELASPRLEAFCAAGPPPEGGRRVWAAFLSPAAGEALESWEALAATPEPAGFGEAVSRLSRGYLLPRLLFRRGQYVEAATAFSTQAVRAASAPDGGSAGAEGSKTRLLEERISALSLAATAAKAAGSDGAARLGADFIRAADEQAQLARLQLGVVLELERLGAADPAVPGSALAALAASKGVPASSLAADLASQAEAAAGSLLELTAVFKLAWDAQLWSASLAVLDFAAPHRAYPEYVDFALQQLLAPATADGAAPAPWSEVRAVVARLRKAHPTDYVFCLDTICALLERRALTEPPASGASGAVVSLLSPASGAVRPDVSWGGLYACYAGTHHCGRRMRALWEESPATQLHLLGSLVTLLRGWLEAARSSADEMRRLVSAARELAIAGDLDAHIVRLGGDLASSPSADLAPRLHTDLRDLRAALSALTRS